MKKLKKSHLILIAVSVLILLACIGMTAYLLFSNYQNVRLFKQAQDNFQRGDADSLALAEKQLKQVISKDSDNEAAYIMLGEISGKNKNYPEQVYYCYMAHRLNPLSAENQEKYLRSLCFARYFDRMENFLAQQSERSEKEEQLLLYAAGRNGNINKYKIAPGNGKTLQELAILLFKDRLSTNRQKLEKLQSFSDDDPFVQQELFTAKAGLYLAERDFANAEKILKQAYELNPFVFAPVLGRFYAYFRSFKEALPVLENYLDNWHDPVVAMQTAEIYCLLKQTDKISLLRKKFQSDSGNIAMLCCYYLDALTALVNNDMAALKELTQPLRKNINTPLARFMFLYVDIDSGNPAAVNSSYSALLANRNFANLHENADSMVSVYLKNSLAKSYDRDEHLSALAVRLYNRKPDVFTAKFILLMQKKRNAVNSSLLKDALTRFGDDPGIMKIAIEYHLDNEVEESGRLIAAFKKKFPGRDREMLRYEIIMAVKMRDYDRASMLFQKNFSADILPEYWAFASSTMREKDLMFLSKDKHYAPFCMALLKLKNGDEKSACDLLQSADAKGNQTLLFFSAKTLAENGRNQAALEKYAQFPQNSSYRLAVLMNMAELYAENGDLNMALTLSAEAYALAPDLPEVQFCYADKLRRSGQMVRIPEVIKLSSSSAASSFRRELEKLWIAGVQARLQTYDVKKQSEKIRELCRQLLVVDPGNNTALELLKQLKKMPQ